jgi:hypothetical protein
LHFGYFLLLVLLLLGQELMSTLSCLAEDAYPCTQNHLFE